MQDQIIAEKSARGECTAISPRNYICSLRQQPHTTHQAHIDEDDSTIRVVDIWEDLPESNLPAQS